MTIEYDDKRAAVKDEIVKHHVMMRENESHYDLFFDDELVNSPILSNKGLLHRDVSALMAQHIYNFIGGPIKFMSGRGEIAVAGQDVDGLVLATATLNHFSFRNITQALSIHRTEKGDVHIRGDRSDVLFCFLLEGVAADIEETIDNIKKLESENIKTLLVMPLIETCDPQQKRRKIFDKIDVYNNPVVYHPVFEKEELIMKKYLDRQMPF